MLSTVVAWSRSNGTLLLRTPDTCSVYPNGSPAGSEDWALEPIDVLACGRDAMPLSIAFVLPYGEPSDGFFPDTLLALLAGEARAAGHRVSLLRAYYHGKDAAEDAAIASRIERFLEEKQADVVVVERLFDPAPLERHLENDPKRTAVLVSRGDSFEPTGGVRFVVGKTPGTTRRGDTRRTPTTAELARSFARLVAALEGGEDPREVPGVAEVSAQGTLRAGPPPEPAELARPLRLVLVQDVVAPPGPLPVVKRKTLLGNAGCPFSADPAENPHYAGATLPEGISRKGCAFCSMGGDYEKRPDDVVVGELVEQALAFAQADAAIEELVLSDQHALRYLARLVREAFSAGVRPMRYLFAARVDSFVREMHRVEEAIRAAEETGSVVEVYLSGFEAFSDKELVRYNKGTTVAEELAAVAEMRRLAREHPRGFSYAKAKGHSLILWNPWTSPEDVEESLEHVREKGLRELFHELGKNRLRLYRDLPIFWAATRDGAIAEAWEDEDAGAGRRKGYNVELPWRFLDVRTRLAYDLAVALRERLGAETEVGQLFSIVRLSGSRDAATLNVPTEREKVLAALDGFQGKVKSLAGPRERPARGASERASVVLLAGACNNGCAACPNRDEWLDDREESIFSRVDEARAKGLPMVFAGREPTMHPAFLRLVARASGADGRPVGVVSNGRRFAYPNFAMAAVRAGLSAATIKVFAPEEGAADRISRDEKGFSQACAAFGVLRKAGIGAIELRAPIHAENLAMFGRYAELGKRLGADAVRVECALDAVGLDHLTEAAEALDSLALACERNGVALEVSPLEAGTRLFDRLPRPTGRRSGGTP